MKQVFWLLLLSFVSITNTYAGMYSGLTPGISTKLDTDKVLGAPIKEVIAGQRYEYDPGDHDAKRLSVVFDQKTGVVQKISLYFKEQYSQSQLREWFRLGAPIKNEIDFDGNLVEYYMPNGIALHYDGPKNVFGIASLSFFNPAILAKKSETPVRAYSDAESYEEKPRIFIDHASSASQEYSRQNTDQDWFNEWQKEQPKVTQRVDDGTKDTFYAIGKMLGQYALGKVNQDMQEAGLTETEPQTTTTTQTSNDQYWQDIFNAASGRSQGAKTASLQGVEQMIPGALLQDSFNNESKGKGSLNYNQLTQWQVASGSIDLIGNGFWDYFPGNGLHIDLDGTTSSGATLRSKEAFQLTPGKYQLQFDIAGNPISSRGPNTVIVRLGNIYQESFTVQSKEPFKTISRSINVTSTAKVRLEFQDTGSDNEGAFLDNVLFGTFKGTPKIGGTSQSVSSSSHQKLDTYEDIFTLPPLSDDGQSQERQVKEIYPEIEQRQVREVYPEKYNKHEW